MIQFFIFKMQVWGSSARASLPWEAIPKTLEECNEKVLNAIQIVPSHFQTYNATH